jgi:hypothetical protein
MNQINADMSVVEIESGELPSLNSEQIEEAITELNATQLALIGGGTGFVSF